VSRQSLLIPLAIFIALVVILAFGFRLEDPHLLPSEMINRPFPEFSLRELHDETRLLSVADLKGEVSLVNVWATWCPNCVIEHPELLRISREEGIPVYGVNYNDETTLAVQWLKKRQDPYRLVIVDDEGKLGIDLGVYGAPETFIVDRNGVIQHRHVGAVTPDVYRQVFVPIIEQLR
jgi:cytochrome c biogenesis protein CcmG, thiol:disulfide interchange protein DsbE